MCNQQGRTGGIAARLYVDSWAAGVSGGDGGASTAPRRTSRLMIRIERRGLRRYPCSGCGRRVSRVRSVARSDVGRSAVGGASGDAGLSAAAAAVSALRDSDRADRVRRPEGAGDAPLAATDWARLSVDADQSCGRAPSGELGQGAPRRARVSRRVGSAAVRNTGPATSAPTRFTAAKASSSGPCCRIWCAAR